MEELVWNYSNVKLYSLFRDSHFIKYDEEPPILGRDSYYIAIELLLFEITRVHFF